MNTNLVNKIILLADDDPEDAEMFSLALSDVDPSIKFHHVTSGSSVIEFLQQQPEDLMPDVIFMDINMPEMSGWQCLSTLKSNALTKDIPVLIYSTSSHYHDRQTALDLGALAFITKPSDYRTLEKLLYAVTANPHADIKNTIDNLQ
jgi:CheY-like chemotaxis protein